MPDLMVLIYPFHFKSIPHLLFTSHFKEIFLFPPNDDKFQRYNLSFNVAGGGYIMKFIWIQVGFKDSVFFILKKNYLIANLSFFQGKRFSLSLIILGLRFSCKDYYWNSFVFLNYVKCSCFVKKTLFQLWPFHDGSAESHSYEWCIISRG